MTMNKDQFSAALTDRGLDKAEDAAAFLGFSRRMIFRIKAGVYPCPKAAAKLLKLMVKRRISVNSVERL